MLGWLNNRPTLKQFAMKNLHKIRNDDIPERVKLAMLWFQTTWVGRDRGFLIWNHKNPNEFQYEIDRYNGKVYEVDFPTYINATRGSISQKLNRFDITKVKII